MRKHWIIKDSQNNLATVIANHRPSSAVCEMPEGEDVAWLVIEDAPLEEGGGKRAVVDQSAKDAELAARAAAATAEAANKAANQYKLDRRNAYPPIGDQLDALYKKLALDDSTDWDAIAAQIAQVKTDYPKPE